MCGYGVTLASPGGGAVAGSLREEAIPLSDGPSRLFSVRSAPEGDRQPFRSFCPAAESSIGTAASHGCIRMRVADVIDRYDRVPVGTAVLIK